MVSLYFILLSISSLSMPLTLIMRLALTCLCVLSVISIGVSSPSGPALSEPRPPLCRSDAVSEVCNHELPAVLHRQLDPLFAQRAIDLELAFRQQLHRAWDDSEEVPGRESAALAQQSKSREKNVDAQQLHPRQVVGRHSDL